MPNQEKVSDSRSIFSFHKMPEFLQEEAGFRTFAKLHFFDTSDLLSSIYDLSSPILSGLISVPMHRISWLCVVVLNGSSIRAVLVEPYVNE
jgi:hypothetical protein